MSLLTLYSLQFLQKITVGVAPFSSCLLPPWLTLAIGAGLCLLSMPVSDDLAALLEGWFSLLGHAFLFADVFS
jgi:hypothetical protein